VKALRIHSYDTLDSLALDDVPLPEPQAGEVRVKVEASGISFVDILRAQGKYQIRMPLPYIGGNEFAGVVDAVGAGVTSVSVGQKVAGSAYGAWGEYLCVSEDMVYATGARAGDLAQSVETALLPVAYGTAMYALANRGQVKAGETVLVLGAAGGVGFAAVQVAKAFGARVIAGASTAAKRDAALRGGADEAVDTSDAEWKELVKRMAGPKGVDIVYDPVGGKATDTAFRTLGWGGRLLVVGFASGSIGTLGANLPLLKGASMVGVDLRAFGEREPDAAAANLRRVMDLHASGAFTPLVAKAVPAVSFAEAIAAARDSATIGRVALTW
jgi:NADPH2:quinone reductase